MSNFPYKKPIKGGCLCKAIRYEISGDVLNAGICHCRSCQLTTGSAYYPFIVVKEEAIKITGNVKEFTRTGSSGKSVHAGFCATCGSTVFGRPELWEGVRTISAASLDHPEEYIPAVNVWTEEAQPWVAMHEHMPRFERNPVKSK